MPIIRKPAPKPRPEPKPGTKPDDFQLRRQQSLEARGIKPREEPSFRGLAFESDDGGGRGYGGFAFNAEDARRVIERLHRYTDGFGGDWNESSTDEATRLYMEYMRDRDNGSFRAQSEREQADLERLAKAKRIQLKEVEDRIRAHPSLASLAASVDFSTGENRLKVTRIDARTLDIDPSLDCAGDEVLRFLDGIPLKTDQADDGTIPPLPYGRNHQCVWQKDPATGIRTCKTCGDSVHWESASHGAYKRKPEPTNGLHPSDITEPGLYWWLPAQQKTDGETAIRYTDWTPVQVIKHLHSSVMMFRPFGFSATETALDETQVPGTFIGPIAKPTDYPPA